MVTTCLYLFLFSLPKKCTPFISISDPLDLSLSNVDVIYIQYLYHHDATDVFIADVHGVWHLGVAIRVGFGLAAMAGFRSCFHTCRHEPPFKGFKLVSFTKNAFSVEEVDPTPWLADICLGEATTSRLWLQPRMKYRVIATPVDLSLIH
ncbi:hypothetical protein Tco_0792316 [Tanacetum coccineum]